MSETPSPSLYEINTRIWLGERARAIGRPATLDDVPDAEIERIAGRGFDWVWMMGVWHTGEAGRRISGTLPHWRDEHRAALPDLTDEDICGSPFAVRAYEVHPDFGGDAALDRFRGRLRARGVRLMLDFVPNHTAPDHPWVFQRPEYYVRGEDADLAREPGNYARVETRRGPLILAHGRDPYFPGWPDTLQLDYRNPEVRAAMADALRGVAARCDGVRCDMAMLLLPDVFARTWGGPPPAPFWPDAIARARDERPGFSFLAEVYWDREWELQQQGFDFTYDKRLLDRLRARDAAAVRAHLGAGIEFQRRSARFLENHDEPRAAATFEPEVHRAAAVVAYLTPGLRFFHEGQFEGRRIRASVHLARRAEEAIDAELGAFYDRLLDLLLRPEVRSGRWSLLDARPAWEGNPTSGPFVAFAWRGESGRLLLVAINYGPTRGQCRVRPPEGSVRGRTLVLRDRLGDGEYGREGDDLEANGLFIDLPAWGCHAFEVADRRG